VARKKTLDHRHHKARQHRSAHLHALTQRRVRWQQPDAQGLPEDPVAMQVLDRVEVALALHQQTQVAAHDIAGGHAAAHRQGCIDVSKRGASVCRQ
jgi:hypothetical protein